MKTKITVPKAAIFLEAKLLEGQVVSATETHMQTHAWLGMSGVWHQARPCVRTRMTVLPALTLQLQGTRPRGVGPANQRQQHQLIRLHRMLYLIREQSFAKVTACYLHHIHSVNITCLINVDWITLDLC